MVLTASYGDLKGGKAVKISNNIKQLLNKKHEPVYIKYVNSLDICGTNKIIISGRKKPGVLKMFQKIDCNNGDIYFLLIGYGDEDKDYDAEPLCGGKCKRGESCNEACKRENYEELGRVLKKSYFEENVGYEQNNKLRYYLTKPTNYEPVNCTEQIEKNNNVDDFQNTVKSIVYGQLEEMLNFLSTCSPKDKKEKITYYALHILNDDFIREYGNTRSNNNVVLNYSSGKMETHTIPHIKINKD